jgi:large subunit ribosomal protein L4
MNKKERRKALFCVLSSKLLNKNLVIIDKIDFKEIKTKNMVELFNKIQYEKNVLIATSSRDEMIEKSTANLPYIKSIHVNYLNIKDLLKYKTLVLLKDTLDNLNLLAK